MNGRECFNAYSCCLESERTAERLQKIIAAAGLCSRRTAEEWISAGRVSVNGETA
ncbi:MAG: hypothetical protein IIX99_02225, partial [Oscillospiraceae bacterium]|nr:hypothetical protein [Oscillospiraceae bacterium]